MGHNNVTLQLASLDQLPMADGELDAAWLVLVLPYFAEGAGILREAARVLKPHAPLIIVECLRMIASYIDKKWVTCDSG